jgi:hypothetical protein
MRYLCLAYGDGKDFELLSKSEQEKLFEQDVLIRKRGGVTATVRPATTVHSTSGKVVTRAGPFAVGRVPLVGFSFIDAKDWMKSSTSSRRRPAGSAESERASATAEKWPGRLLQA